MGKRKMLKQAALAIITGGASLAAGAAAGAAGAAEAAGAAQGAAGAAQGASAASAAPAAAQGPTATGATLDASVAPAPATPSAPTPTQGSLGQAFNEQFSLDKIMRRFKDQSDWDQNPLNNIANRLTGGLFGRFNRPGDLTAMDLFGTEKADNEKQQMNMMMSNMLLNSFGQQAPPSMMSSIVSLANPMNYMQ